MSEMEVLIVMWGEIPKQHHVDILQTLACGEYVNDLPYSMAQALKRFKIPLSSTRTIAQPYDAPNATVDEAYMEFERVAVVNLGGGRTFVWKKVGSQSAMAEMLNDIY